MDAAQREKMWEVYTLLDEMLHQWENYEIEDVTIFMLDWAERLSG